MEEQAVSSMWVCTVVCPVVCRYFSGVQCRDGRGDPLEHTPMTGTSNSERKKTECCDLARLQSACTIPCRRHLQRQTKDWLCVADLSADRAAYVMLASLLLIYSGERRSISTSRALFATEEKEKS